MQIECHILFLRIKADNYILKSAVELYQLDPSEMHTLFHKIYIIKNFI